MVGRETALREIKERLGVFAETSISDTTQVLTAIRGWPGVGKTTIAAALSHDEEVRRVFPDGCFWTSLGQTPNLEAELAMWGHAIGDTGVHHGRDLQESTRRLAGFMREKRALFIVDDAWEVTHIAPFLIGGQRCATLVTTREPALARSIAPTPDCIFTLDVLSDAKALDLFKQLAPSVAESFPAETHDLLETLEGLPLAIQVAGRLLHAESSYGLSARDLLEELKVGVRILESQAPVDRQDLAAQTIPSVAVLLKKSTDRLDEETRLRFSDLGILLPKPATFDVGAMGAIWSVDDPMPTIRTLIDRGLLERVGGSNRFQMHALIAVHARNLGLQE